MKLAEKIRACRKASHLTQAELGKRLGVNCAAVSKWELGTVTNVPLDKLKVMSQMFGVPVSYFTDDDDRLSQKRAELISIVRGLSEEEVDAVLRILRR